MSRSLSERARELSRLARSRLGAFFAKLPSGVRRGAKPVLLRVALVVSALFATYLIVANVLVMTPLLRNLASSEESLELDYRSAFTLWPGRVSVEGLELRCEDYNVQFEVRLERGVVDVSLTDLLRRRFRAVHVDADGVSFRMRHKVHEVGKNAERLRAYPPIEGFSDPPLYVGPEPPPIPENEYDLWEIALDEVEARVSEIWILEYRFEGAGRVEGGFRLRPSRFFEVLPAKLDIDSGALTVAGKPVARELEASLDVTVPQTDVERTTGLAVLASLDAALDLDARRGELAFADVYLRPQAGATADGALTLRGKVRVQKAKLVPPTRLDLALERVSVNTGSERVRTPDLDAHAEATGERLLAVHARIPELDVTVGEPAKSAGELVGLELDARLSRAGLSELPRLERFEARTKALHVEQLGRLQAPLARRGVALGLAGQLDGHFELAFQKHRAPELLAEARLIGVEVRAKNVGVAASGRAKFGLEPAKGDAERGVGSLLVDVPVVRLVQGGDATDPLSLRVESSDIEVWDGGERAAATVRVEGKGADSLLALAIGAEPLRALTGFVLGLDRLAASARIAKNPENTRLELTRFESGALEATGSRIGRRRVRPWVHSCSRPIWPTWGSRSEAAKPKFRSWSATIGCRRIGRSWSRRRTPRDPRVPCWFDAILSYARRSLAFTRLGGRSSWVVYLPLADRYVGTRRPMSSATTASTKNTRNRIFAMPTAPAAMPPKPKIAAIRAMMKKTAAQ